MSRSGAIRKEPQLNLEQAEANLKSAFFSVEEKDFGSGFVGGHETFGSWGTTGVSGQVISRGFDEDSQREWFVQRNAINFGLGELDKMLNAYSDVGDFRNYTQSEVDHINEIYKRRTTLNDDLSFVHEHLNGNMDAVLDVEGNSFNDRWGVNPEDAEGLKDFWDLAKEHPSYMAGAVTAELIKDLPLELLIWLGVIAAPVTGGASATASAAGIAAKANKVSHVAKALNKLNNIQPKALRGLAKMGTGIAAGAAVGGGYEAIYDLLEQGDVKAKNVKAGMQFGAVFGVLGGLGILGKTAKDLHDRTKPVEEVKTKEQEALEVIQAEEIQQVQKSLVPEDTADEIKAPLKFITENHDTTLFPSLRKNKDYKVITVKEARELKLDDHLEGIENKASRIVYSRDGIEPAHIIIDDGLLSNKLDNYNETISKKTPDKELSASQLELLKSDKESQKAFVLAHELSHLDQKRRGLYQERPKDPNDLTDAELAYARERETHANQEAILELERAYNEALKGFSQSDKHVVDVLAEMNARLLKERAAKPEDNPDKITNPSKVVEFLEAGKYRTLGLAGAAGVTAGVLTGEEGDTFSNAMLAAGAVALGSKGYRLAKGENLKASVMKAKHQIAKDLETNFNEGKEFEAEMQSIGKKIDDNFKTVEEGHLLIDYIERGKDPAVGNKLSQEQRKIADEITDLLNIIGDAAVEAKIIKGKKDVAELKVNNFKDKDNKGAFLANYFPHIFKQTLTDIEIEELIKVWGKADSGSGKARTMKGTLAQIQELIDNGQFTSNRKLELVTSPGVALSTYVQAMTRAIIGRNVITSMEKLDLAPTSKDKMTPAIMSREEFEALSKGDKPYFTTQEALHYETFTHPALKDKVAHTSVKHVLDDFFVTASKGGIAGTMEKLLTLNNTLKRVFVFGSLFHAQALLMSGIYSLGASGVVKGVMGKGTLVKGKEGSRTITWKDLSLESGTFRGFAKEAIKDGLQVINIKRQELVNPGKIPVDDILRQLGVPGKWIGKGFDTIDYVTWELLHDRFKLAVYLRQKEKLMKRGVFAGKLTEDQAGKQAAKFANDAFGSLDWNDFTTKLYEYAADRPNTYRAKVANATAELLPVNKRRWLNLGLFAPDWTISNIRIVGRVGTLGYTVSKEFAKAVHRGDTKAWKSKEGAELIRSWNMYAAYSARAGIYTSALWYGITTLNDQEASVDTLFDFWFGDNSGKVELGNGESMVISKQIAEPIHWVQHPMHTLANKGSIVPKTLLEALYNKQWFSMKKGTPLGPRLIDEDGTTHYSKWILGKMVPIVSKPLFSEDFGWKEKIERTASGFFGFPQYGEPWDED